MGCSSLCCTNQAEMYCPQNTLRRVWHPCHTHATCHDRILPRMAQINTDGQGARYPTECTEVSCCGRMQWQLCWCTSCLVGAVETTAPPGRVRGYGRDAIPSYNCTDWEGVLKYLCASVISVGEYLSKNFCEFGEFCGKIVWWQRGYGRMPYPPISAPPEEISLSTCLLVNLSTNKKKNYAEQDNTLLA